MGEAAQGEPKKHEVFEKPFKVEPVYESWKTPINYRRFPGGEKLPSALKVWRIQRLTDKPGQIKPPFGVVSRSWGYEDSPDAEVIVPGYNTGKENGAVGIGRHASILQWGFSAPPSKMTDAGRALFLNCVCYISKFDGKRPLIHRASVDRFSGFRLITKERFDSGLFPPELVKKFRGDPDGMVDHYRKHYELIYCDGVTFKIDTELEALRIGSNRKIETLEKLIALLRDQEKDGDAAKLLARYTRETFETPEQWEAWLKKNRERIYFSDVGGYRFFVMPEGYLDPAPAKPRAAR